MVRCQKTNEGGFGCMNELERMKALKELLNEDEVIEFNNCLQVLNQTFKQMLGKVKEKVLESNESNVGINSTTELFEAIQKISSLADKYGIKFPKISDGAEAQLYVVKYGKDVLFS